MPASMFAESIAFAGRALSIITSRSGYSIVQIGSHNGDNANDCLHRTIRRNFQDGAPAIPGTTILIEPVPKFFEKLKCSYQGIPGLHFENIAISDQPGPASFYYLPFDASEFGYPDWLDQLGSLKKEVLLRTRTGGLYEWHDFYETNRVEIQVQCQTLDFILSKYELKHLDALMIDAEGYDGRILSTLSFDEDRPTYIQFESSLLSSSEKDGVVSKLMQSNYVVQDMGFDTIACLPELIAEMQIYQV